MRTIVGTVLVIGALLVAGCQSPVAGTWKMAPDQQVGKISFGAMTLAHDGTFMAESKYEGTTKVMIGCYKFTGDKLTFCADGKKREYGAKLVGDCLTITHEDSSVKMCRQKACCKGGGSGCKGKCGGKCGSKEKPAA